MDDHHDIRRGSVLALRGSVVNAHFPDGLPELYSELRAGPERTAASSSKWSAISTRKPRRASLSTPPRVSPAARPSSTPATPSGFR